MGGVLNLVELFCLIGGGLILVVGQFLFLFRWRFAPRRGDTPYCRKCQYNLTGVVGATHDPAAAPAANTRCPECGTELTDRGILRGERDRRRWVLIVGLLGTLIGFSAIACFVTGVAAKVDVYAQLPTSWLFDDLGGGPPSQQRAGAELFRRADAHQLSPAHRLKLTEWCLAQLERDAAAANYKSYVRRSLVAPGWPVPEAWRFLSGELAAGRLASTQQTRLYEQFIRLSVHIRSRVARGQSVPLHIVDDWEGPDGYFIAWRLRVSSPDDLPSPLPTARGLWSLGGSWTSVTIPFTVPKEPRIYLVKFEFDVKVCAGQRPTGMAMDEVFDRTESVHRYKIASTVALSVCADRPEDLIVLKRDATVDANMLRQLCIRAVKLSSNGDLTPDFERSAPDGMAITAAVDIVDPQTGKSVVIRVPRPTYSTPVLTMLESLVAVGPELRNPRLQSLPPLVGDTVNVILKPSIEAVLATPDTYEMWGGELIFENVPVIKVDPGDPYYSTKEPQRPAIFGKLLNPQSQPAER